MGVYIPPCSNVEGSINICISNVATVYTTEVLAIPNAYMTALMASLRSVCRRNDGDLDLMMLLEKKEGWVNVYKYQIHDTPESAKESLCKGITDYIKTIKVEWEE